MRIILTLGIVSFSIASAVAQPTQPGRAPVTEPEITAC